MITRISFVFLFRLIVLMVSLAKTRSWWRSCWTNVLWFYPTNTWWFVNDFTRYVLNHSKENICISFQVSGFRSRWSTRQRQDLGNLLDDSAERIVHDYARQAADDLTNLLLIHVLKSFQVDCPDGQLGKDKILDMYSMILPVGNAKLFVDQIFRIFDKVTFK